MNKDILFSLALQMDLPTIKKFRLACKKFNSVINKYFWTKKLQIDYNLETEHEVENYYKEIYRWTRYHDKDFLLEIGIEEIRYDLIKVAVERGAIVDRKSGDCFLIVKAMVYASGEIMDFLLPHIHLSSFKLIIHDVIKLSDYLGFNGRLNLLLNFYEKLLPYLYEKDDFMPLYVRYAASKLEALYSHEDYREYFRDIYKKRMPEYKKYF